MGVTSSTNTFRVWIHMLISSGSPLLIWLPAKPVNQLVLEGSSIGPFLSWGKKVSETLAVVLSPVVSNSWQPRGLQHSRPPCLRTWVWQKWQWAHSHLLPYDRGWDGWMASLTRWMWVGVNSGSWWWTGRPGMLWFMGSQRVRHDWATKLNWTHMIKWHKSTYIHWSNVQFYYT